ncbi:uncharacterized protein LOC122643507 [Telopea speciosissima]|uniref:uncharacterized protein LOC122643507 n=1 Tax=Telopea speciosissima TaxID=54955 RepID=UPI001CC44684|nr:uncharacterized protein LOC122643507 [Telopea speciosissima]
MGNRPVLDYEELERLIQNSIDPAYRLAIRRVYRKPYLDYVDNIDLERNWKIPEFTKFLGEDNMSIIEHIARFTVQCGNLGANDAVKLRLFLNSLIGSAFTWYFHLPANLVQNWQEMDELFHTQFYKTELETTIGDLAQMRQEPGETVDKFINHFKLAKYKCPTLLHEGEYAKMALGRLNLELKKWFAGQNFTDLGQLVIQAAPYEALLKEEEQCKASSIGTYYKEAASGSYLLLGAGEPKAVSFVDCEVEAAKITERKPYVCKALAKQARNDRQTEQAKPAPQRTFDPGVKYSFNISKAELIFDQLLQDKQIKLPPGHQIPASADLKDQRYYKWHNTRTHMTINCVVLCNALQKAITNGQIKFPEKEKGVMLVDEKSFSCQYVER